MQPKQPQRRRSSFFEEVNPKLFSFKINLHQIRLKNKGLRKKAKQIIFSPNPKSQDNGSPNCPPAVCKRLLTASMISLTAWHRLLSKAINAFAGSNRPNEPLDSAGLPFDSEKEKPGSFSVADVLLKMEKNYEIIKGHNKRARNAIKFMRGFSEEQPQPSRKNSLNYVELGFHKLSIPFEVLQYELALLGTMSLWSQFYFYVRQHFAEAFFYSQKIVIKILKELEENVHPDLLLKQTKSLLFHAKLQIQSKKEREATLTVNKAIEKVLKMLSVIAKNKSEEIVARKLNSQWDQGLYLAGISFYNLGFCYEKLGEDEKMAESYRTMASFCEVFFQENDEMVQFSKFLLKEVSSLPKPIPLNELTEAFEVIRTLSREMLDQEAVQTPASSESEEGLEKIEVRWKTEEEKKREGQKIYLAKTRQSQKASQKETGIIKKTKFASPLAKGDSGIPIISHFNESSMSPGKMLETDEFPFKALMQFGETTNQGTEADTFEVQEKSPMLRGKEVRNNSNQDIWKVTSPGKMFTEDSLYTEEFKKDGKGKHYSLGDLLGDEKTGMVNYPWMKKRQAGVKRTRTKGSRGRPDTADARFPRKYVPHALTSTECICFGLVA